MVLHGKGIFGQRRTAGMPWIKCRVCGKRTYLRDRRHEEEWRKKATCSGCENRDDVWHIVIPYRPEPREDEAGGMR